VSAREQEVWLGPAGGRAFSASAMPALQVSVGQCSDKGRKQVNQDFHGFAVPKEPLLGAKGIAVALADGIGSSDVSQVASETAVKAFLEDFYSTSEAWSVKNSVRRVLQATNSWLYAQTRSGPSRYDLDRGYVCAFAALVLKSRTAHVFHAGDVRVYQSGEAGLEQLTEDHRLRVSRDKAYLSRALGMRDSIEIDYRELPVAEGDTFVLASDGVYEFVDEGALAQRIRRSEDLDATAREIVAEALANGSPDNLTVQIVRVERLPSPDRGEVRQHASALPFPPALRPRMDFDGYRIVREIHHSHRSHVYLAVDRETGDQVALKVPSVGLRDDPQHLERFLMEEWIARRVSSVHLLRTPDRARQRSYLYSVTEWVEGRTLRQWMADNPRPDLETARKIVEQIGAGLQALHRQDMLHQDLRPDNVMIDANGTVKLIDFGSVQVAGVAETAAGGREEQALGTAQYAAPECMLGEPGTTQSDLFSLGVIAYQLLCGRLPYDAHLARAASRSAQRKLRYRTLSGVRDVPPWVDGAIRKAVHPDPRKRYEAVSEFLYDLRHPNPAFAEADGAPLLERNPLVFWQTLCLVLLVALLAVLSG